MRDGSFCLRAHSRSVYDNLPIDTFRPICQVEKGLRSATHIAQHVKHGVWAVGRAMYRVWPHLSAPLTSSQRAVPGRTHISLLEIRTNNCRSSQYPAQLWEAPTDGFTDQWWWCYGVVLGLSAGGAHPYFGQKEKNLM